MEIIMKGISIGEMKIGDSASLPRLSLKQIFISTQA